MKVMNFLIFRAQIKTDGNAPERSIKIEQRAFDALIKMRPTWQNVSSPLEV